MSSSNVDQALISDFINAIRGNDMVTVIDLIETGRVNVNTPLDDGFTPLLCAILTGSADCVEFLVRNGANVNITTIGGDYDGVSALHYAIPDISKMRILLSAGADVNVTDPNGRTVLMEYLTRNYVVSEELVRLLAEYKFNFTATNKSGCNHLTLLMAFANSADAFDPELFMKSLKALGTHMDIKFDCSKCPIFDLKRMGYNESGELSNFTSLASIAMFLAINKYITNTGNIDFELVQRIAVETGLGIPQEDAPFLLQAAVRADSEEAFVQLVTRGINPFIVNCEGFNVVSYCVYHNATKVLAALSDFAKFLDEIAEKEGRPIPRGGLKYSGYTSPERDPITGNPLFLGLIRQSAVEIFDVLIGSGFSVNDREITSLLPMPFALVTAAFGRWDVLQLLLNSHTGTNVVDISSSADDKAVELLKNMPGAQALPEAFEQADVRNVVTLALLANESATVSVCLDFGTTVPTAIGDKPTKQYLKENGCIEALAALEAFETRPKVIDAAFAASKGAAASAQAATSRAFSTWARAAPHSQAQTMCSMLPNLVYHPKSSKSTFSAAVTAAQGLRRVARLLK